VDFSKLGELCSLVSVNVMALTATATSDILKVVKKRLSLLDPAVIGLSPNVHNIFYSAAKLPKLADFCNHAVVHCFNEISCVVPKDNYFLSELQ